MTDRPKPELTPEEQERRRQLRADRRFIAAVTGVPWRKARKLYREDANLPGAARLLLKLAKRRARAESEQSDDLLLAPASAEPRKERTP